MAMGENEKDILVAALDTIGTIYSANKETQSSQDNLYLITMM